jgi:NAD(P)H dehydrogenase (quinone)
MNFSGDPLETIWKKCVFDLCGVKNVHRRTFSVIVASTPQQRAEWLDEVRATVRRHFPAKPAIHELTVLACD